MPYASLQDLIDRFGEAELKVAAGTGPTAAREIDTVKVDRALQDADTLIDGYLARRFVVPVSPVPPRLVALACDIARHQIRNRSEGGGNTVDLVRDRYKAAVKEMEDMRDGKVALSGAVLSGAQDVGRVSYAAGPSFFSGNGAGLKGFI